MSLAAARHIRIRRGRDRFGPKVFDKGIERHTIVAATVQ